MEHNLPADASLLQEELQVSGEERARILRQIDQVVGEARRPPAAEVLAVRARKRGILLPIVVNAVTAAIVAGGVFGLAYAFRREQVPAALRSSGFQTAEGRMLEVFRVQSESRLQEQASRTQEAQEKLRAAEGSLEKRLKAREVELRKAMDAELAGERARLEARGVAVAEIESRLRALEMERRIALSEEVGRLRAVLAARPGLRTEALLGAPVRPADPALRARLEAAEGRLAEARAQAEQNQARLSERERQIAQLQRQLRSQEAGAEAELARSGRALEEQRQRVDRLSSQLAAASARADSQAQQLQTAGESAERSGRERALKEVVTFLDYLKGEPARKEQLAAQLAARVRQDPLYGTVVREIQILAAGAGLAASDVPLKLWGTVSSISSGRVVVEPLVELPVKAGARVQIRRSSGLGSDVLVARGTVQQAAGGRITVALEPGSKEGRSPQAMDAVYVETGE